MQVFHQQAQGGRLQRIVIDEAHAALFDTWRPVMFDVRRFGGIPLVPFLLTTATLSPRYESELRQVYGLPSLAVIRRPTDRRNVRLSVEELPMSVKMEDRVRQLAQSFTLRSRAVIVYIRTRAEAQQYAAVIGCGFYHSRAATSGHHPDLEDEEAETAAHLSAFLEGKTWCLVSTSAAVAGIDRADIGGVLHVKAPYTATQWVQALGRAGRDGQFAEAIVLLEQSQRTEWEERHRGVIYDDAAGEDATALRTLLKKHDVCRRQSISSFMDGDVWACGELGADAGCDVCDPDRLCVASGGGALPVQSNTGRKGKGKGKGRNSSGGGGGGDGRDYNGGLYDTSMDAALAQMLQEEENLAKEDALLGADRLLASTAFLEEGDDAIPFPVDVDIDIDAVAKENGLDVDFFLDDHDPVDILLPDSLEERRPGGPSSGEVETGGSSSSISSGFAEAAAASSIRDQARSTRKKRNLSSYSSAVGGVSQPELVKRICMAKNRSTTAAAAAAATAGRTYGGVPLSRNTSVHGSSSGSSSAIPILQSMMPPPPTPPLSSSRSSTDVRYPSSSFFGLSSSNDHHHLAAYTTPPSSSPSEQRRRSTAASAASVAAGAVGVAGGNPGTLVRRDTPGAVAAIAAAATAATAANAGTLVRRAPAGTAVVQSRSTGARHGGMKEHAIRIVQAAYHEFSGHCPICFVLRLPDVEHSVAVCQLRNRYPGYVKARFSPYAACYLSYAPQLICGCWVIGSDSKRSCQITNNTWIQRALFVLASDPAAFQNAVDIARSGFSGLPPYSVEITFPEEAGVPPPEWFVCVRWLDIQVYPAFVLIAALLLS
ncbi:hypothetical protein CF319_g6151 [Tilletia indica]|nr:hypothetical protein CF319_g6151 [Tilletia indica]